MLVKYLTNNNNRNKIIYNIKKRKCFCKYLRKYFLPPEITLKHGLFYSTN